MKKTVFTIAIITAIVSGVCGQASIKKRLVFSYDKNGNEESRTIELLDENGNSISQDYQSFMVSGVLIKVQTMPNPASSYLNINIIENFDSKNTHSLVLTNSQGVIYTNMKLTEPYNEIDLRSYSSGNYVVRMTIGNTVKTWNIIKL